MNGCCESCETCAHIEEMTDFDDLWSITKQLDIYSPKRGKEGEICKERERGIYFGPIFYTPMML